MYIFNYSCAVQEIQVSKFYLQITKAVLLNPESKKEKNQATVTKKGNEGYKTKDKFMQIKIIPPRLRWWPSG